MKKYFALLLATALLLSGCGEMTKDTTPDNTEPDQNLQGQKVSTQIHTEAMFSQRDRDGSYEKNKSAVITLNGTSASCESDAVMIDGTTVTITDEGTYILSGELYDGRIVVNADKEDKTQLVLAGASVNCTSSAAIYVLQADKVFITLAEGTENALSNGDSFEAIDDNNIDGAVFSKEDLTLNGKGSLTVTSPAGHGIESKDAFTVAGGSYVIECASHGLAGKDSIAIADAAITVTAGKDGIHAENNDDTELGYLYMESGSLAIRAEGDGISASNSMQINGGLIDIISGGGSENAQKPTSDGWGNMGGGFGGGMGGKPGMKPRSVATTDTSEDSTSLKGIKAACDLVINGGNFTMDCADDGVHSNANLTVTGGNFEIATGDDGFHADETLTVTGGQIKITESYEGLEGLHIKISGGDITLTASDDGLNAAGGTDESGFGGIREDNFGGGFGGRPGGGFGGGMSAGNGSITISGGTLDITASGDGIDANGTLEITGGHTTVCGPTRGDTATLDYDKSGVISGGTFIGTGASGMAQTFSDSEQGVIALQVGNQSAGTKITVADSKGNVLLEHAPALDYAIVIFSCPEIVKGESYTVSVGTMSNTFQAS